ncbi:MAG: pseudouridine synthase [Thermotogota bacterium]
MLTVQKALQTLGMSRRKAADYIKDKGVKVNGKLVKEPWFEIEYGDDLEFDGLKHKFEKIKEKKEDKVYYLLNKPKEVLCAMEDPFGRKTIKDMIKNKIREKNVFHVGRLDYNTSGIILLTNDGDLANYLLHPKYKVEKIYDVLVMGHPKKEELKQLESGIEIEGGVKTQPAKIEKVKKKGNNHQVVIKITEGRKRQVRLMFKALGYTVLNLKRLAFGPWEIKRVPKEGDIVKLDNFEVNKLFKKLK